MVEKTQYARAKESESIYMINLPKLAYSAQKRASEVINIRGINYGDNYDNGALAESLNISTRRFPLFTVRNERLMQENYENVIALTSWDKLVVIKKVNNDYKLYYDGTEVSEYSFLEGEKQFAVVNSKLIIWPDKVAFDIASRTIQPLGAEASGTGATITNKNLITISWAGVDLTTKFKVDDAIFITGFPTSSNNKEGIKIVAVTANTLKFADDSFTNETATGTVKFERKIPDLDYICESENRLWGCSNSGKTIYASALGDPFNFYVDAANANGSYALAIGSEGDFTGCCKLGSSVLFWKANQLHKILGGYPAEYEMYSYALEGVSKGSNKSLIVINETLFYLGLHGVFSYSGGSTSYVSQQFGNKTFSNGVAGTDGEKYFLSCKKGDERYLLVFDTKTGIWLREDDSNVVDFARNGKDIYLLLSDGKIYLEDSGQESSTISWNMEFSPFKENSDTSQNVMNKKKYKRLILRVEMSKGSWASIETKCDDNAWEEHKKIIGENADVKTVALPITSCDKFSIRISGVGQFTLKNMIREYTLGGDK